jgi:hypothetical protein
LISYYKTNGITFLKKHVAAHHAIVSKRFEEEMNSLMQGKEDKEPTQKRQNVFWRIYLKSNHYKRFLQKG